MFVIEAPAATKFGGGLVVMARSCWVFYLFKKKKKSIMVIFN